MKRASGLLALLLLLGAGWLEVSWYIGKRVQLASQEWVEDANRRLHAELPGVPLTLDTASYDRGLLSSHARYVLRLRVPAGPDRLAPPGGGYDLAWLNVDIKHGPYPLRPANSLDGRPGARGGALTAAARAVIDIKGAPALASALDIPQPMSLATIDARIDYGGGASVQWRMPPCRSLTKGTYVNWHGATGHGRLEPDGALRMSAWFDGLTAGESSAATASSGLSGLALTVDLAAGQHVLRPGTVNLTIARWRDAFMDDDGKAQSWEMQDLQWQSEVVRNEGGQDLHASYRLGALRIGATGLGQGSGRMALTRIDGDALTRAWDNGRQLAGALVLGQAAPESVSESVTNLSRAVLALLNHKPRLTLEDVTWQSPRGDRATLDMALQMGPTPDRTLNTSPLWAALERVRGMDLKARVPGPMLGDFPALGAALRQTGLFVDDGPDLAAAIHTDEDRATVNGTAMSTTQWLTRHAGTRPPSVPEPGATGHAGGP